MEIHLIKDYLAEFGKRRFGEVLKREIEIKLLKGKAISIIGPRRAGKTYFFYSLIKNLKREEVIYLDFEESFLMNLGPIDILKIIFEVFPEMNGNLPKYVFLDEIQNISHWHSLVRTLLNRNLYVFLTGSSSKLLSKEIATSLRGRTLSYLLFPFSFREIIKLKKIKCNLNLLECQGRIKKELKEYLEIGGFPEIVLMKEEKDKIIKEYVDLAFFKDFVERHRIQNLKLGRFMFNFLLQNFSNEFSVRKIEKKLKSIEMGYNLKTLYDYVDKLEDTLFVFFLRKFSWKIHEKESWPKKVYICDLGISRVFRVSEDIGKKMENIVFLDLLRSTNQNPLYQLYYYKTKEGYEVDFIIKEGTKIKQLIQVTDANNKNDIKSREIKALLKAREELKCKNLLVITWDYEAEENDIKFVPLWKWLLNPFI